MRETRKEAFIINNESAEQLLQRVGTLYQCDESRLLTFREYFFDTFDWRLFDQEYLLRRRAKTYSLSLNDDTDSISATGPSRDRLFYHDFPEGKLREVIQSIVEVRALLLIFFVKTSRKTYNLRNPDKKTVLRLFIDDVLVSGNDMERRLPLTLSLEEVRGYDKAFSRVCRLLRNDGLQSIPGKPSLFQAALDLIEKKPGDYSSKFSLPLEKDSSVQKMVSLIVLHLTEVMERNFNGVTSDIDSEFLHDFRIAIRRTRSLLSHVNKLFPADTFTPFQEHLRWLGSLTGPVRDLDVYLTAREKYQSMLPEQLHKGLHEFFVDLERLRKTKLNTLRKGLASGRYQKLMKDWKKFAQTTIFDIPTEEQSCYPPAVKMIRKRFVQVIKKGRKIDNGSPDLALHRLRIQGKKLRYLLEFFLSFFDSKENTEDIDFFIKNLKKLQNNLGDFNDLSVQINMLDGYRRKLTGRNKRSILIASALGGLLAHLAEQRQEIRTKYESTFTQFADEENQQKFLRTFVVEEGCTDRK